MMTREEYNFWLANLTNIGIKKIELLLRVFGTAEEVFNTSGEELDAFKKECCPVQLRFHAADINTILRDRDPEKIHAQYIKLTESGIAFVSKESEHYPEKLRNIYNAPFGLYVRGRLPKQGEKVLAVVGARECTPYGKEMAKYLSGAVAREGVSVISGLARGIDACAHQGALTDGGITYGVLGCGIDICYPKENIHLFMELLNTGGIISEYAPGIQPVAGNFPMRNRIISALSDGILVVEAREKSGSLITVDYGLEQGKDIFALPGRATDRLSEGCNNLIKMGAKLVSAPKDILEELIPDYRERREGSGRCGNLFNDLEETICACLNSDPKHIEEIAVLTMLPMDHLMEQLLIMELRGLLRQPMKNYYCKVY